MAEDKSLVKPGQVEYQTFYRKTVQAADKIQDIWIKSGRPSVIEGEAGWKLVTEMFNIWAKLNAREYVSFLKSQQKKRQGVFNDFAASEKKKENLGGQVRHIIEVPKEFMNILSIYFSDEKWGEKKVREMAKRMPVFKIPRKV